jgi:hypothetical protein
MATFDQLSPEQRAIIELILKQGQTYAELGDTLDMSPKRVRTLASKALLKLSPVSGAGVEEGQRGQITDYLLLQSSEGESAVAKRHLRRSETARAWARSILDSLEQFYDPDDLPAIPEGGSGAADTSKPKAAKAEESSEEPAGARALSAEAKQIVKRRRIAGVISFAVVALLMILLWPVGVLTGGDDGDKADAQDEARAAPRVIGQLVLKPVQRAQGAGVAAIAERGKERSLVVQARVVPNKNRQAYEVWLYNSNRDAKSLGAQVTDRQGTYQGAARLPKDFARYKFIDISRENVDENARHSGQSILRGRIADFAAPPPTPQGQGTTTQP